MTTTLKTIVMEAIENTLDENGYRTVVQYTASNVVHISALGDTLTPTKQVILDFQSGYFTAKKAESADHLASFWQNESHGNATVEDAVEKISDYLLTEAREQGRV